MFNFFKNKQQHQHLYDTVVGEYYVLRRAKHPYCFDEIAIYQKQQCRCGVLKDQPIHTEDFLPALYYKDNGCAEYIQQLKNDGLMTKYEMTKYIMNR